MRTRTTLAAAALLAAGALLGWLAASGDPPANLFAQDKAAEKPAAGGSPVLPAPEPPFGGVIGRKASESKPDFPKAVTAPKGAPNVLLILTDDTGFGAASTFGGPIPTPALDRVAAAGLRYNTFHTTALCSPTRAALLTGRNHHSVGFGNISEFATGYPGYDSILPKGAGTIANILVENGYNTSWFGKNHLIPDWLESPDGPFDQWPSGLGFEYFYGFLGGDTDNWHPALFENNRAVLPPVGDPNYILIHDMGDRAINWIRTQHAIAPQKPFFMYFAPGNGHAPHHAAKDWIAKFKGKFDLGWDKQREVTLANQKKLGVVPADAVLTPRPKEIPAWDSLNDDEEKVYARMMEVYAAAVAQSDYEIGRILDSLQESGQLDDTMVIYIEGDNGASAEGTLQGLTNELGGQLEPESLAFKLSIMDQLGSDRTYNHYPVGWAHAMDTPFQWTKQVASHFGGTRNGMAISWPKRIKARGELRSQFTHVIDIEPTILEAVGVQAPQTLNGAQQMPLEGVSMAYTFDDAKAPTRHATQYFEIVGNRGLYHDGWMASTTPLRLPWEVVGAEPDPDDFPWELYNVAGDFSQSKNLAKENPKKLQELQALFLIEAARHNVLPIDSSFAERANPALRPGFNTGRTEFTYYPGMIRIPEANAPDIKNKSFHIAAEVELPAGAADGVLVTQGGRFGGWGLLVLDGKPMFAYAYSNQDGERYPDQKKSKTRIASGDKLTPGKHTIAFDFKYDGGGIGKGGQGTLTVDGKKAAEGRLDKTLPFRFSLDESFDVGEDTGTPVIDEYDAKMPFPFTGTLRKVEFQLDSDKLTPKERGELERLGKEWALAAQ
ncbi:MAG TPA: arylsulfatase [Gemmataceae bacterium]|nr:arylsulfatase [Gemmataceae bacterium]